MPRPSSHLRAAILDGAPTCLLADIDHPDGMVHVWSGIGTLVYNNISYTGIGILGRVTPIGSTMESVISDFKIELRGVPQTAAQFLNRDVRNRPADIWYGALDKQGKVIPEPYLVCNGIMDYQELQVAEDGSATISITVIGGLWTLDTALNQAWTTEEQIKIYPGDTGLDSLPALVNKQVNWTRT